MSQQFLNKKAGFVLAAGFALWCIAGAVSADETPIADAPIFAINKVPPNLMFALSVEWPTGVVAAYNDNASTETGSTCSGRDGGRGICYFEGREYLGYFDPEKCYTYSDTDKYFSPSSVGIGTYKHKCDGAWSGNFLNWATMHGIDTFRHVMTGGDRYIDTANLTVIEKARHTGQGGHTQFPVKLVQSTKNVAPNTVTPNNWTALYVRVTNGDTALQVSGDSDSRGRIMQVANNSGFSTSGSSNRVDTYYVRVKVCDSSVGREANCKQYGSSYKPVGLIQENADRMRFGATSYVYEDPGSSNSSTPGGVLRSHMKDVGPMTIAPVGDAESNVNAEWRASDGVLIGNPDASVAAASGVSNSGVVNYLNKFGKAQGYKGFDTLSEMYYQALRYYRNMSPVAAYLPSPLTTAHKDGFPIITWTGGDADHDPIKYSCQKNFILGIADSNTHCDTLLPGNTLSACTSHAGSISDDDALNVRIMGNKIGQLEGMGAVGERYQGGSGPTTSTGRRSTYHAASAAYWANINDIRPDDPARASTEGKQNVVTYFVDVRETGSDSGKVQMWLAAKYGGFDDINGDGAPAANYTWDTDADGVPDNYFTAANPADLKRSLEAVFNNVLSRQLAAAGTTVLSPIINASGTSAYAVRYNSKDWSGDVMGYALSANANGTLNQVNRWSAQARLDSRTPSTRVIVTYNGTQAVEFTYSGITAATGGLTSTQRSHLGTTAQDRQDLVNYVRGDKSKEGTKFRPRAHILGDIVNSETVVVAAPSAPYSNASNPGYSAFKTTYANRAKMVYVGSNDGMLHAFNGNTTDGTTVGGAEQWAYIPSLVLAGPSGDGVTDGLASRAKLNNFEHKYLVDGTPVVQDIDFDRTYGVTPAPNAGESDWRTILVGGLNKGGRGYYAIDVTNPAAMTTANGVKQKVLWEFTHEDLGDSFSKPLIAKTEKYGWVVIVAGGYNNTAGSVLSNRGKGVLFIVNAKTGALLEQIYTDAGAADNPSGLTYLSGYTQDLSTYIAQQVYGGDLLGNMWRFDLTGTPASYPSPVKLAVLEDESGAAQPITTAPAVALGRNLIDRWVFVGTGKILDSADLNTTQQQTVYGLRDGTKSTVQSTGLPLERDNLTEIVDLMVGANSTDLGNGWFYDLTHTSGSPDNATERVTFDVLANQGLLAWVGSTPSTDPCSPGISSTVYAIDYATGKTVLVDPNGNYVSSTTYANAIVKVQFSVVNGQPSLISSSGSAEGGGTLEDPNRIKPPGAAGRGTRLNWREIMQ